MGSLRQKDKNKCCMGKTQWRLFHLCAREHNNCFLVKPLIYLSILNLENLMTQSAQAATPRKLSVIERTITVVLLTCHLECIHLMPQVCNRGPVGVDGSGLFTLACVARLRLPAHSCCRGSLCSGQLGHHLRNWSLCVSIYLRPDHCPLSHCPTMLGSWWGYSDIFSPLVPHVEYRTWNNSAPSLMRAKTSWLFRLLTSARPSEVWPRDAVA